MSISAWLTTSSGVCISRNINLPIENVLTWVLAYNIALKHANRPVVNVGNTENPIYLPLEVSNIERRQLYSGDLATVQRQNMIQFSCRRRPQNYDSILKGGLDIMGITEDDTMELGLRIKKEMVTVLARILNPPNLKYGMQRISPRSGAWNLVSKKFSVGASIESWTCIWV